MDFIGTIFEWFQDPKFWIFCLVYGSIFGMLFLGLGLAFS